MCAAESGASGVYRPGPVTGADDLALMRRIDELYGSRRMVIELNQAGHGINRKRACKGCCA
jgi:putative transposase